ncbi:MAG: SDR family oxidoreductase [Rhodospirillaceae bacterium]|jgi:3-oxoacyl-[acyl-carrier protein] reductase|nr:SDR family oxidoreductase [Rhodospirillaceae bacterium]MBT5667212.1 SDR family oxidoreductase [Rhodospirillaceae bacterium]MBT5812591.1 SDR family oxidoreductase [Rhodospirillaceae bacterium]
MQIEFKGQSVLVTGAVRGIGRTIAHGFAARGATVFATDILADELTDAVASATPAGGGAIFARPLDITDFTAVSALVGEIEAQSATGKVDIAVHAAGGIRSKIAQPIEDVSHEDWQAIFDVNVNGAFNVVKAVTPGMKRGHKGQIVVIASPAGLRTSRTGIQSYAMSKAGQIGLVRQLAQELGPFGIRVNAVAPGFIASSPDYQRQWDSYGEEGQAALVESIALRRLARPEDIAHSVMFLASDYADFITGQTLPVNGSP